MVEFYVFVYGSLKKGFENHNWLKNNKAQFFSKGVTKPEFKLYSVNDYYPAISKGDEKISGEVYKVDKNCLQELDYLEGYPKYYNRDFFVINCDGFSVNAYVYYIKNMKNTYGNELPSNSKRIKRENNIATWINK